MDGKCSEGRRQLLAILAATTRAAVARKLRTVRPSTCRVAVGYWASGERVPLYAARCALQELYSIPIPSWDQPAVLEQVVVPGASAPIFLAS